MLFFFLGVLLLLAGRHLRIRKRCFRSRLALGHAFALGIQINKPLLENLVTTLAGRSRLMNLENFVLVQPYLETTPTNRDSCATTMC